jgi:myo-inositol-1(or 4)-monophosphatase
MDHIRDFAVGITREAGDFLKGKLREGVRVDYKGEINIVTEADHMSEVMLLSRIRSRFPDHDILTEESAGVQQGSACRWIIDPLDGTTNYSHGYPVFCVSVGFEKKGQTVLGVVYNPMLDELFVAEKGKGAFLNGRKIGVSKTRELTKSLLATGFPYDIRENPDNNINYFNVLALRAQAIRRAGAAALDLAYVAAGRFDGFWELNLHPWDTAAGWLLVLEAGGCVTDLFGGEFSLRSPHVLATNGLIHGVMAEILRNTDPMDARLAGRKDSR